MKGERPHRRRHDPTHARSSRRAAGVAAVALAAVTFAGCDGQKAEGHAAHYELTAVGDGLNLVALTPEAAERLLLETAPVTEEAVDGQSRLAVPYAALIYDNGGGTWVYVEPEPLTFLRTEVSVDYIEGDTVFLHDGPEPGSEVAVTSVAELYGTDTGVGK